MSIITEILKAPAPQVIGLFFGILLVIIIAEKCGLPVIITIKKLFNIDSVGNNKQLDDLKAQILLLQDNHVHTLEEKIDRLTEKEDEGNLIAKENLFVQKAAREDLKTIIEELRKK